MIHRVYIYLLFSVFWCSAQAQKHHHSKHCWQMIDSPNFCICYPDKLFTMDRSGWMGTKFILFAKYTKSKFIPNIQLIVQNNVPISRTNSIDEFAHIAHRQIERIKNNKIFFDTNFFHHGVMFHQLIYSGEQAHYQLQWQQYYMLKNDVVYILTFTADTSEFWKYQKKINRIMNSFHIK